MRAARTVRAARAIVAAALLIAGGCTMTVENDSANWGGNGDRWDTGSVRGQRDVIVPRAPDGGGGAAGADGVHGTSGGGPPAGAGSGADGDGPNWIDAVVMDVGGQLALFDPPDAGGAPGFTTYASVLGIEVYTPEDLSAADVVEDDRPYAGWGYAGVLRYDTFLDPDAQRRRDVEDEVELDLGLVGPSLHAESIQTRLHDLVGGGSPNGWSNQLEDEPGFILRGRRTRRVAYAEAARGGRPAWEALTRVEGAVGNIDTHGLVGAGVRAGLNLPRGFDVVAGDRSRLLGAPDAVDEPARLYVHVDVDARLVLRNMFLDGNTFKDSHSVDKEEFVHELRAGIAWEHGDWRIGYEWTRRSDEFEGQPEEQTFGAYILSWTPR